MRTTEVIICRACRGENCQVDELVQKEKVEMEEYGRRHAFPRDIWRYQQEARTARRFLISCQDCGEQHEYMERVEPLPQVFLAESSKPHPEMLRLRGIPVDPETIVGDLK